MKLLLRLFVSQVEIHQPGRRKIVIENRASIYQYNTFTTVIEELLRAGLDLEAISSSATIGPVLDPLTAGHPELLAGIVQAMATSNGPVFSFKEAGNGGYQLSRQGSKWRFCFTPRHVQVGAFGPYAKVLPLGLKEYSVPLNLTYSGGEPDIVVRIQGEFLCGRGNSQDLPEKVGNITFGMRSVEGMILFLGEMVRSQLGLAGSSPPISATLRVGL
jgi:hypothetical protein